MALPPLKKVAAKFFRTAAGNEPVRDFLKAQKDADRRLIGVDIAKVEFGWPIGMPTAKSLGDGLHEVRTDLPRNRICCVFFCISDDGEMILLHAIIKKTQKTPPEDLKLARRRTAQHRVAGRKERVGGRG